MELRSAETGDVEAVRAVARAAWEADYDAVSRESAADGLREWYAPDRVRAAVESEGDVVVVARTDPDESDGGAAGDDAVVGFAHAVVAPTDPAGAILRLYVHPDRRRTGLGSRLLAETVSRLRERGCERIEAMALAENDVADAFYRDGGFEPVATEETTIGGERYEETRYRLTRREG